MIYGRVVGTLWATRKEPLLEGSTFLIVERLEFSGARTGQHLVAVDAVSAGVGELVLVAQGSSARQTAATRDRPVDAVIMAIVDSLELDSTQRAAVAAAAAQRPAG
jgi:ethanolamine utilization protein EutN/carbon dioxide concentrating mechanism protein CcmL